MVPIFFVRTWSVLPAEGPAGDPGALAEGDRLLLLALAGRAGSPSPVYGRAVGRQQGAAGGLLQATKLTFVNVATVMGKGNGEGSRSAPRPPLCAAG